MTDQPRDEAEPALPTWTRSGLVGPDAAHRLTRQSRLGFALIPLLLVIVLAWWGVLHIQNNVELAAPLILSEAGINPDTLDFDATYRDLAITGSLPVDTSEDELKRVLLQGRGPDDEQIRQVTVRAEPAAAAQLGQINVRVTFDGDTIVLSGTVPSESHRDVLLSSARDSGLDVVANITNSGLAPAAIDPSDQISALGNLLAALGAGVSSADLSLGDSGPVVGSVHALDADAADELRSFAGPDVSVTAPVELGETDVQITFDGTRIVLTGDIVTDDQRDTLIIAAAAVVGRGRVVDNMDVLELQEAVPGTAARVSALADAIDTFVGLTMGDARLNDTDLTVNGEAVDDDARGRTAAVLEAAATVGLRPGGDLRVAPAEPSLDEQEILLRAELAAMAEEMSETLVFDGDSAVLTNASRATLSRVVRLLDLYSKPTVEVGGHTDSLGPAAYNLALSELRVAAVVEYLLSRGVDPERLEAVGYGETAPVADNASQEQRVLNRRVEIVVPEITKQAGDDQ